MYGVRTSQAPELGITRDRLYGPGWRRVSHGLYAPRHDESSDGDRDGDRDGDGDREAGQQLLRRCAALSSVLPRGGAIAHLTAAHLLGLWVPPLPSWLPTLVVLPPGEIRPERAGMYVFRCRAGLPDPVVVDGVRVVPPAVCLGQLAEDLTLIDLVVAIDGALHGELCTADDIVANVRARQRGLPVLRQALTLCDGRAESPWETVLRLLHVLCGIDVEPQRVVRNEAGQALARGDLWIKGTRRLSEYDGAVHRERVQHHNDLARDKALSRAGWERYGYVADEIRTDPELIVRDAEKALGLAHDPSRTVDWLVLASLSTLTAEGRIRLARRLHRFHRPLRGRKAPGAP